MKTQGAIVGAGPAGLRRVWSSVRFSEWQTMLLHRLPDQTELDQRAQEQELYHLSQSALARRPWPSSTSPLPH